MNRAVIGSPPVSALILAFGPAPAFLGLLCGHQPRAAQHGEVGRMAIGRAGGERLHRRDRGVVAHDADEGVQERALAVRAGAIAEEHRVLAGDAGQAVAGDALQEGLQLGSPPVMRSRKLSPDADSRRPAPPR